MKPRILLPWLFFALIVVGFITPTISLLMNPGPAPLRWVEIIFPLIPVAFAFAGALIISRQPGNMIGILMMLPGVSMFGLTDYYFRPFILGYSALPDSPSLVFMLLLWLSSWNWVLLVFPLMFIMLLFPTGKPLNPRWTWLVYLGIGLGAALPLSATFSQTLAPASGGAAWSFTNPIGFLSADLINTIFTPLLALFPVWIVLCAVSLFVRFSRARSVEREQIKWLFFAAAVFTLCYVPSFIGNSYDSTESVWNLLFAFGLIVFPVSIGVAILRYRLYDIEIIIRRTMVYSLLTALLGLVYFGGVTVLQGIFAVLTGQTSPAALVISTLLIAALFNPLRKRLQDFIDRRFYRQKYDAEQALEAFAAAARSETDLARLSGRLTTTVQESLQPERISLWMQPANPLRGEIYERQKVQE